MDADVPQAPAEEVAAEAAEDAPAADAPADAEAPADADAPPEEPAADAEVAGEEAGEAAAGEEAAGEGAAGEEPGGEAGAEAGGEASAEAGGEASEEAGGEAGGETGGEAGGAGGNEDAAEAPADDADGGDPAEAPAEEGVGEVDGLPPDADGLPSDADGPLPGEGGDADAEADAESLPEGGIDSNMVSGELGDDYESGDEDLGDEDDDEEELEEEEPEEDKPDPLQELQEKYDQLLELNERFTQTNNMLQRRVIQRKMQDKSYDTAEKPSEGRVTEHKYQNLLNDVHSVRLKLRLQQVKAARMSEELKNQLEAKRQKAIECRDSFQEFKRQVARHAEYARTGKKIAEKIIQEVEEFELDKDAEVEEDRGSNISLKNRLAKLEQQLRKKDELAENLHVIDFEQLKIENQTLNEKIEERNEELHKLRKKTKVYVEITTHMREKVQFVQQEYQVLKQELATLDQDLAAQRDLVAKTKHERDEHRADNGRLRNQTSILNSEHLGKDYEQRAETLVKLQEEVDMFKKRHQQMTAFLKSHGVMA